MTVNHDVVGSSPTAGVKERKLNKFSFFFYLIELTKNEIMIVIDKIYYFNLTVLSCKRSILLKNGFLTLFFDIIFVRLLNWDFRLSEDSLTYGIIT